MFAWQGFFVLFIREHNISHTIIYTVISLYCEIDHLRFSDGPDSGANPGGIGIHTEKLNSRRRKEFLQPVDGGRLVDYFKVMRHIRDMFVSTLFPVHV